MITILEFKNKSCKNIFKKLLYKIIGDRIKVSFNTDTNVEIKTVTYINNSQKINWQKLLKKIGLQRNYVLCAEDAPLEYNCGIKKFISYEFNSRLCVNMLLEMLREAEDMKDAKDLKIGLYDPAGNNSEILKHILKYTSSINVFTNNLLRYKEVSSEIIEDIGAAISFSQAEDFLENCSIVLAPSKIAENLYLNKNCIVLTSQMPSFNLSGNIFYNYSFALPKRFLKIKPGFLSEDYFAGALYTLGRQYKLGSIVPSICHNSVSAHTLSSLAEVIVNYNNVK